MTHKQFIKKIAPEYPDGLLLDPRGDTLALFIVQETRDLWDSKASDIDNLKEMYRALAKAKDELGNVIDAIGTLGFNLKEKI